jgi:TonB family protein
MYGRYTDPERPEIRAPGAWIAAALVVSLALHAGLVVWIAHSRVRIKILAAPSQVREVWIAPPLPGPRLILPRAVARAAGGPVPSPEIAPPPPERGSGAAGTGSGRSGSGTGSGSTSTARVPMVKSGAAGPPPSPLPEIRLHFGSRSDAHGYSDLVLAVPVPGQPGAPANAPPAKEVEDLWAYLYPEIPGGAGGGGAGHGRAAPRSGSGGQRAGAVISVRDPALIAWAGAALSIILTHWNLPADLRTTERIRVEITAVILASGDATSFHILSSSQNIPFDQAALEALRASLPFPAFPETLPYSSIEIRFLFENNG